MNKEHIYINVIFIIGFAIILGVINSNVFRVFNTEIISLNILEREVELKEVLSSQTSTKDFFEKINDKVPSKLDKSIIITTVSQIAQESNIDISAIAVDENKNDGNLIEGDIATLESDKTLSELEDSKPMVNTLKLATIKVSVTGDKLKIYDFIQKLSEVNPYIEVSDLTLSFDKDGGGRNDVESNITAITYYTGI